MIKLIFILSLGFLTQAVNAQAENPFQSMRLEKCTIQEHHLIKDTIYGVAFEGSEIVVNAESKVQMSCNFGNPAANRYSMKKNKLSLIAVHDVSGKLKDSMLAEIKSYIDAKEAWGKLYHVDNDFSNFTFYKSFYLSGSVIIPCIWSGAERDGDFYLYYVNNTLIKIKLLEREGMGALSSFTRENLFLRDKNGDLPLDSYVKTINTARELLEAFKNQ